MKPQPILVACLALQCSLVLAQDSYYHIPLTSVTLSEGKLPAHFEGNRSSWKMAEALQPCAALDGEGEAFVSGEGFAPWASAQPAFQNTFLNLRATKGQTVTGRLFLPAPDFTGMVTLKFKIEPATEKADVKQEFFKAKEEYYRRLRERNIPGGAWFRHQETEAATARGVKVEPPRGNPGFNPRGRQSWDVGYDSTYELFSGGRALSENLQLDRVMAAAGSNSTLVPITNLVGITVREMDWKSLLQNPKPALDPLAAHIPFDQHALFFPNFEALSHWIAEADRDGTPVLQMFEPRAEDANSRGRYQKQLCLELNDLSRLLGPKLIGSSAMTGSDPYLRTGTDVARSA